MQSSIIAILAAAALYLMYDGSSKKVELAKFQNTVSELQGQLSSQQQAAQTAEMAKLEQQIRQLTLERDRATQEAQRLTAADRDRVERDKQRAVQELARAQPAPQAAATQAPKPNWLQQRVDQGTKLDAPASPVGPPFWVDRHGVRHYYN